MAEAAVHALVEVEMVERINEMCPVEMSVNPEHLTEDGLANINKVLREATALANPIFGTRKLGERQIQVRGTSWDWIVGARSIKTTRWISCTAYFWGRCVVCKRDACRVGGEDVGIVKLARDPTLHK